jgi:hypothetical protein
MNSQNYLSNVFRQVYAYSNGQFVPSINLSNVSKITADSLTVTTLSLGGANSNLYFGSNAGSLDANSANNTAIGVEAANGISNSADSVFLGFKAGLGVDGATSVISIGATARGAGTSNIYIGNNTGSAAPTSVSNIYIGHSIDTASAVSNQLRIGQDGNVILAGDFSNRWVGVGSTTPTSGCKFDVSGKTNLAGDVTISAGGNLFVAGDISAGSISTTAISGPNSRLDGGSVYAPSYSFKTDTSLGIYDASGHSMGFANRGIQVMCISGTRVGINTPNPSTTLEVNGDISANSYNGPDGTESAPKYTFSSDRSTGIFLDTGKLSFTVGGVKQMEVTSNGIVNTNTSAIAINKVLRDAVLPVDYDISGGNIRITRTLTTSNIVGTASASNSIGGVTLSNNNIALNGAIVGSTENTSNSIGGVTLSNENIAMWGSIIGLADYASNRIGGVTLSNHDIAMSGTIIGSTANTSNVIGGVTLSNNNITSATGKLRISNIQNGAFGDGQTYAFQEIVSGLSSMVSSAPAMSFQEGGLGGYRHFIRSRHDYNNGFDPQNVGNNAIDFYTNTSFDNTASTAPGVGNTLAMTVTSVGVGIGTDNIGYALNVSGTAYASEGVIASNFTTLNASSNRIGGVILDNSNTTSSNFTTPTASSNNIGGVTLSNNNIAMSGAIVGSTDNTSNRIGGVTLSNGNLNASTLISGSGSNLIGGVTLSNYIIRDATRISTIDFAASGYIRNNTAASEFDISGGNISNSGQLTSSNVRVQAGASNVPTYAFTSDPSAGLFTPNVGTMAFSTGGLTRMCISGTNVGIGTINPTQFLDVSGGQTRLTNTGAALALTSSIGNNNMIFQTTGAVARWGIGLSNAETVTNAGSDINFTRYSDTGTLIDRPLLIQRSTGNVGIGTTQPTSKLVVSDPSGSFHLGAPSGSYPKLQLLGPLFTNPNPGSEVINAEITLAAAGTSSYANCIRSINLGGGAWADCNRMGFFTMLAAGDSVLRERMSILPNGNIGIGATTPLSRLHVIDTTTTTNAGQGIILQTGSIKNGQSNLIEFRGTDGGSSIPLSSITGIDTGTGSSAYRGDLTFMTSPAANSYPERMRIQYDGRIGFNRTTDICGTFYIRAPPVSTDEPCILTLHSSSDTYNQGYTQIRSLNIGPYGMGNAMSFWTRGDRGGGDDTNSNLSNAERMRINYNGVGIGTTTPAYPLDVNGSARATSMYIGAGASPTLAMARVYTRTGLTTSAGGVSIAASALGTLGSYTDAALTNGTYLLTMVAKLSSVVTSTGAAGGNFYLGGGFNGNNMVYLMTFYAVPTANTTFTANAVVSISGIISNATSSTTINLMCQRQLGQNSATVTGEINEIHLMRIL